MGVGKRVEGVGEGGTDMLNQCTLVLEGVTLAEMVEFMIEVLVDLARGSVFDEETTEIA